MPTDVPAPETLKRPDFAPGRPIVLCDGRPWEFPLPVLVDYGFLRDAAGASRLSATYNLDAAYDKLADKYDAAASGAESVVALFDLAYYLLLLNYDLGFDQAATLLRRYRQGDPRGEANTAMWKSIAEVATGTAPKEPSASG